MIILIEAIWFRKKKAKNGYWFIFNTEYFTFVGNGETGHKTEKSICHCYLQNLTGAYYILNESYTLARIFTYYLKLTTCNLIFS